MAITLPQQSRSYWLTTVRAKSYPVLDGNLEAEVAIIGGGITGIMTTYYLSQSGLKVVLIEKNHLLGGVTGHTTGKLTSNHNLVYQYLVTEHGQEKAQIYAQANEQAIGEVERLTEKHQIKADFARTTAYTYALTTEEEEAVGKEVEVAQKLGLPAFFTEVLPLPFKTKGAVGFHSQAIFHPLKFLFALAEEIVNQGGQIFENTKALGITDGQPVEVKTKQGIVRAKTAVIATNFPIYDRCGFFNRQWPKRSYVLAVKLKGVLPEGVFISANENYHSIRPHPPDSILLLGGEPHKTGQGGKTTQRYERLYDYGGKYFHLASIDYRWSTQDNIPDDHIPYIGKASPSAKHLFVATGFKGWGMTHGIVAGQLLADLVMGRKNPWQETYDPCRVNLSTLPRATFRQGLNAVGHYLGDRLSHAEKETIDELGAETGQIIAIQGKKLAVYKDAKQRLYFLSPVCSHLGCLVSWNEAEKSWDCPCHGSRYTPTGKVIHSPAVRGLKKIDLST